MASTHVDFFLHGDAAKAVVTVYSRAASSPGQEACVRINARGASITLHGLTLEFAQRIADTINNRPASSEAADQDAA